MTAEYEIKITPVGEKVYDALRNPCIKIILMPGGTRSSKTFSIMQNIHLYMLEFPYARVTAWRAMQTWVRLSILNDWEREFLAKSNIARMYRSTKIPPVFTLRQTDATLEFSGLDDPQKVHGVAGDIIWINEAVESKRETFRQLLQRCRGKIILDYNPSEEEHWVYDLAKRDDCTVIHSTYKDNPFLSDTIIQEIEAYEDTPLNRARGTASKYHWEVYGLGLPSHREGLIYTYEVIPEWPEDAERWGYGLDFGFFPDPAAFARVGLFNGKIVIDELFYEHKLNNVVILENPDYPSIQKKFQELGIKRRDEVYADKAGRTSINELCTAGYKVEGVDKYPGSVNDGIKLMQQYCPLQITARSVNAIKEAKNYTWIKDAASGTITKTPIDKNNHILDLVRYVTQAKKGKKQGNKIRAFGFKNN